MRYLYTTSLFIWLLNTAATAQEESKLGLGLNASSNIINLANNYYSYNGGICIEPIVIYKLPNRFKLRTTLGYTNVSNQHDVTDYQKIRYINEGFYIKMGITRDFRHNNKLLTSSYGLNLVYTHFNERGNYLIRGNYFGDYYSNYSVKGQKAFLLEPNLDLYLLNTKYIGIFANISVPIGIVNSIKTEYPHYYIPGFGYSYKIFSKEYFVSLWTAIYVIFPLNFQQNR
jgi:hypothetical protein